MQRKKLLLSILLIGVMAVAFSAGTYAWFFDDEVSTNNRFQTGTIDIEVEDVTATAGGDPKRVAELDGHNLLKPSQVGYLTKKVTNVGNNPARIFKKIPHVTGSYGVSAEPETDEREPNGATKILLYHMDFDLTVDDTELIPYSETTPTDNTSFLSMFGKWIYLGTLQPDHQMIVTQSFHLQADADGDTNWAQDDWMRFPEDFKGVQVTGAPNPTPEFTLP